MSRPANRRVALATSDLRNSACGVGNSIGALLEQLPGLEPLVIDTGAPWSTFREAGRSAAGEADVVVVAYPTLSTSRRPSSLWRLAALRWWFRRGRVRLYLHEFGRLGRKHRSGVVLGLFLTDDRVVVCVPSEALAVSRAGWGLATRGQEVVAVPSINGTAPDERAVRAAFAASAAAGPDRSRTAGVFGTYRPDKGPEWLDDVLGRLDPRFDRLELVGAGWDACPLSTRVTGRYEITRLGHVPTVELPETLGRWGLAIAPFWEGGTHDGRGSLRTPLAFGVPTLTRRPAPGDLTLDVPHLHLDDRETIAAIPETDEATRRAGAAAVAAHEAQALARTAQALFDTGP